MIVTNIRIEPPSDNPSLAQRCLDLWSSAFDWVATLAAMAGPYGMALAMVRLGRVWMPARGGEARNR